MAKRPRFLRLTCAKFYYLGTVFCWLVTTGVLITRLRDYTLYGSYAIQRVPAFRLTPGQAVSTQSNQTPFTSLIDGDVHIYSAIARNSSRGVFYDVIGLNGWEYLPLRNTEYRCCLFYDFGDIQRVSLVNKLHWYFPGKAKLEAKQFVCPNPRHSNKTLPSAVSLTLNECPDNATSYVQVETPYTVAKDRIRLAVCTKLAFGNLSASEIVEWFEFQKLLGISKVITYTHKLNADAMEVLKYYKSEGIGEYYPFDLPDRDRFRRSVGVKNFQSWNDEQVVVLDCHGRLMGYPYIGLYDMDEFIIPRHFPTILHLLLHMKKMSPRAAGYTFKTEIYATTWGRMDTDMPTDFITGQYLNRTKPFQDRPKSIIITDRVEPGRLSTHGYWIKRGENLSKPVVPESFAVLKHYRSCRKEWLKKGGEKCYRNITRVTDKSMLKWVQKIEFKAKQIKMKILSKDKG